MPNRDKSRCTFKVCCDMTFVDCFAEHWTCQQIYIYMAANKLFGTPCLLGSSMASTAILWSEQLSIARNHHKMRRQRGLKRLALAKPLNGFMRTLPEWLQLLRGSSWSIIIIFVIATLIITSLSASHWVSIRHPAEVWHYVTLFEKLGSKSSMGFCSLLWIVLSDQKNRKHTWYIFKEIVWLRSGKREGMCPTENQLAKFLKSWLGDSIKRSPSKLLQSSSWQVDFQQHESMTAYNSEMVKFASLSIALADHRKVHGIGLLMITSTHWVRCTTDLCISPWKWEFWAKSHAKAWGMIAASSRAYVGWPPTFGSQQSTVS